jgi:hypothetical protein
VLVFISLNQCHQHVTLVRFGRVFIGLKEGFEPAEDGLQVVIIADGLNYH